MTRTYTTSDSAPRLSPAAALLLTTTLILLLSATPVKSQGQCFPLTNSKFCKSWADYKVHPESFAPVATLLGANYFANVTDVEGFDRGMATLATEDGLKPMMQLLGCPSMDPNIVRYRISVLCAFVVGYSFCPDPDSPRRQLRSTPTLCRTTWDEFMKSIEVRKDTSICPRAAGNIVETDWIFNSVAMPVAVAQETTGCVAYDVLEADTCGFTNDPKALDRAQTYCTSGTGDSCCQRMLSLTTNQSPSRPSSSPATDNNLTAASQSTSSSPSSIVIIASTVGCLFVVLAVVGAIVVTLRRKKGGRGLQHVYSIKKPARGLYGSHRPGSETSTTAMVGGGTRASVKSASSGSFTNTLTSWMAEEDRVFDGRGPMVNLRDAPPQMHGTHSPLPVRVVVGDGGEPGTSSQIESHPSPSLSHSTTTAVAPEQDPSLSPPAAPLGPAPVPSHHSPPVVVHPAGPLDPDMVHALNLSEDEAQMIADTYRDTLNRGTTTKSWGGVSGRSGTSTARSDSPTGIEISSALPTVAEDEGDVESRDSGRRT
ncbi:hypothetical protein HK102_014164 [Quaeritorhiza haematococci]|nr:hypothetical protein HK102_014164 [Quaeritorhiza haematococci]